MRKVKSAVPLNTKRADGKIYSHSEKLNRQVLSLLTDFISSTEINVVFCIY